MKALRKLIRSDGQRDKRAKLLLYMAAISAVIWVVSSCITTDARATEEQLRYFGAIGFLWSLLLASAIYGLPLSYKLLIRFWFWGKEKRSVHPVEKVAVGFVALFPASLGLSVLALISRPYTTSIPQAAVMVLSIIVSIAIVVAVLGIVMLWVTPIIRKIYRWEKKRWDIRTGDYNPYRHY